MGKLIYCHCLGARPSRPRKLLHTSHTTHGATRSGLKNHLFSSSSSSFFVHIEYKNRWSSPPRWTRFIRLLWRVLASTLVDAAQKAFSFFFIYLFIYWIFSVKRGFSLQHAVLFHWYVCAWVVVPAYSKYPVRRRFGGTFPSTEFSISSLWRARLLLCNNTHLFLLFRIAFLFKKKKKEEDGCRDVREDGKSHSWRCEEGETHSNGQLGEEEEEEQVRDSHLWLLREREEIYVSAIEWTGWSTRLDSLSSLDTGKRRGKTQLFPPRSPLWLTETF